MYKIIANCEELNKSLDDISIDTLSSKMFVSLAFSLFSLSLLTVILFFIYRSVPLVERWNKRWKCLSASQRRTDGSWCNPLIAVITCGICEAGVTNPDWHGAFVSARSLITATHGDPLESCHPSTTKWQMKCVRHFCCCTCLSARSTAYLSQLRWIGAFY